MFVMYGKGKVGLAIKRLLDKFDMPNIIMDDEDMNEAELVNSQKIIVTPGIPSHHIVYQKYANKVIGELDLVWDILQSNGLLQSFEFIGITGTKGKSTTSWIAYNMFSSIYNGIFQSLGLNSMVWIGGNFDEPLSNIINEILEKNLVDRKHIVVLEVSSFMSYRLTRFKFDWSIWTNLSPDHLNWHPDFEDYFQSKLNVFKNTVNKCIAPVELSKIENFIPQDKIIYYDKEEVQSNFLGDHNLYNIGAVLSLMKEYINYKNFNISKEYFINLLKDIYPLDHRLQCIKELQGIKIYDDGKSTTASSTKAAIDAFPENVVLITGGMDKGDDFDILKNNFSGNVAFGVFIGQLSEKLINIADQSKLSYFNAENMEDAVQMAYEKAKILGVNIILFSPCGSSFDMFKNRADRVEHFIAEVEKLN